MWLRVHENMYNLDNIRSMVFKYKNHCADPEESNVNSVFIEFNNGQSTTRYFKHMNELFKVEQKFLIACGEYSTDSGSSYADTIDTHSPLPLKENETVYAGTRADFILDVTNASTFRVRFSTLVGNDDTSTGASTSMDKTYFRFVRLADT